MALSQMIMAWNTKVGNSTRKLILMKLADQANDDGYCWPSQNSIAESVECQRQTVNVHIKALEKDGLIEIIHRNREDGSKTSNAYQLNLHPMSEIQTCPVSNSDILNQSVEPVSLKKSKKDKKLPEEFEKLWTGYGPRGGKEKAYTYWKKLDQEDKAVLAESIGPYTRDRELGFRSHLFRYIRDREFESVVEAESLTTESIQACPVPSQNAARMLEEQQAQLAKEEPGDPTTLTNLFNPDDDGVPF